MQKQMKRIAIGLIAALGTSFANADSAPKLVSNAASSAESRHVAHAPAEIGRSQSSTGWRYVGGEPGWILEAGNASGQNGKSRAQVLQELAEYRQSPAAQLRHLSLYLGGS